MATQVGRYLVSSEDDGVYVFDPITENQVILPFSAAPDIDTLTEEELVPFFESKVSRKRSPRNVSDQPSSQRCR